MDNSKRRTLGRDEIVRGDDAWGEPGGVERAPYDQDIGKKVSDVCVPPVVFWRKCKTIPKAKNLVVNIVMTDGQRREIANANAAFYSETHDRFIVYVSGDEVFSEKMGDIAEIEIYAA